MNPIQVALLKEFQNEHHSWTGVPLSVDGDLGPRTQWALAIDDLPLFRRRIADGLLFCTGVKETTGANRDPWIDHIVLEAGGKLGDPWCAALVHYILTTAGVDCLKTVSSVACQRQFPITHDPQPMDLAGWENGDGTGHVFFVAGFVEKRYGGTEVVTFEGNSHDRFRMCVRAKAGLTFRAVQAPTYQAIIPRDQGVVVTRAVQGTR